MYDYAGGGRVYRDGILYKSDPSMHKYCNSSGTSAFGIGNDGNGNVACPGTYDEVVLGKKIRSADWIKLCFENQKTNQTLVEKHLDYAASQWEEINTPFEWNVTNAFAVTGMNGSNLFAGTRYAGVYRSIDNGENWTQVNSGLTSGDVRAFAVIGDRLFAGAQSGGVFVSTNNGASWNTASNGLPPYGSFRAFGVSGTSIFVGTYYNGIYRSTNSGASWTALDNNGLPVGCAVYAFAVDGVNIYAGTFGQGVYRSSDNGANWTPVNTGLSYHLYINSLAAIGRNIFVGTNSGGVFLSHDNGANWISVANGMTSTYINALVTSGTTLFAATDIGYPAGVFMTNDFGANWSPLNTGMYNNTAINALAVMSGRNVFASTTNGHIYRISP
ncbi:MAG: hypothetical protein PHC61_14260 [Chitinivibrionales bacterium]|nr:hypothetical protein [Chitinivibrionales bacterium]